MIKINNWKRLLFPSIIVIIGVLAYHFFGNLIAVKNAIDTILNIIKPILVGFVIAYILNLPMSFIEQLLSKTKLKQKSKRTFSVLLTFVFIIVVLTIFMLIIVPELARSISKLIEQIPAPEVMQATLYSWVDDLNVPKDVVTWISNQWTTMADKITQFSSYIITMLTNYVTGLASSLINLILSLSISVYMLADKENLIFTLKKVSYSFVKESYVKKIIYFMGVLNNSFKNFIQGQLTEAVILGILCFVGMAILKFPYALLISIVIGATNIIPFFGPYIGAGIAVVLLFMISPMTTLYFLIYIIVLQQLESNIIYPRVVGSSLGINGFWILIGVTLGNSIAGIIGILIGIPLLATIYVIVQEESDKKLKEKNYVVVGNDITKKHEKTVKS